MHRYAWNLLSVAAVYLYHLLEELPRSKLKPGSRMAQNSEIFSIPWLEQCPKLNSLDVGLRTALSISACDGRYLKIT